MASPPPLPPVLAADESSATSISNAELESVRPWRLMVSVLLATFIADWLFVGVWVPALSLAVFAIVCAAMILWNRDGWRTDRGLWWAAPVFLLAVAQAAIDVSWLNGFMLFLLLTLLAGTQFSRPWSERWPGWLEAILAWPKAPAQWKRANAILKAAKEARKEEASPEKLRRIAAILLPGLILLIVFGAFLGAGNAMVGNYLAGVWESLADYLETLTDINGFRICFWVIIATMALALCYPGRCGRFVRACTADWRRFSLSSDRQVSLWQTWISLAALNGLYLFVNSLDVFYLWMNTELPTGVSYSSFVHEGVFALIASTVLAGLVVSFFFQQSDDIARSKPARILALAWIAQNLILLSGVALRLHLYVEAFGWSVLRFHVGSFLVLTTFGFALLSIYVIQAKSLRWLVLSNLVATFSLLYLLQFANVNGWVARWNVERWLAAEHQTSLDTDYLGALGPAAWPALRLAADTDSSAGQRSAEAELEKARKLAKIHEREKTWRSWQWRYTHWKKALVE